LVYLEGKGACSFSPNMSNHIVISDREEGCSVAKKLLTAQNGGAIALIVTETILVGSFARAQEDIRTEQTTIPVISVYRDCIHEILVSSNVTSLATATLFPPLENHWLTIYDSGWFYFLQVLIGILTFILMLLCFGFTIYYIYDLRRITTKIVILVCEGILNLILFVIVLDICNSRGLYSYHTSLNLSSISYSIIALTNLLMAFFFLELFSKELVSARESFIPKYKIHFLIFSAVSLLIRIILGILSTFYLGPIIIPSLSGTILVLSNLLSLFVLIAVLYRCYKETSNDDQLKIVRVVVFRFVIICILLTIFAMSPAFVVNSTMYETTYEGRLLANYLIIISWMLSFFKIYKMIVPTVKEIYSSKDTSKKISHIKSQKN
jgi:hypothetical protein